MKAPWAVGIGELGRLPFPRQEINTDRYKTYLLGAVEGKIYRRIFI
jgi:hypothetical protein